jgi:hypothetical protein
MLVSGLRFAAFMRLGRLLGSAIVFVPLLLICAGRLNAQRGSTPQGMTQEVNRCLTVMRVAASRRKTGRDGRQQEKRRASLSSDSGCAFGQPRARAKSA